MSQYRERTLLLRVKLQGLDIAVASDVHASVLDELGRAVRKCDERLDRAHPDDEGSLDWNAN